MGGIHNVRSGFYYNGRDFGWLSSLPGWLAGLLICFSKRFLEEEGIDWCLEEGKIVQLVCVARSERVRIGFEWISLDLLATFCF